nr:nonstructural protein [Porcine parvovirus 6]
MSQTFWTGICRLFPDIGKIPGVTPERYIYAVNVSTRNGQKWPKVGTEGPLAAGVLQGEALFRETLKEVRKVCRLPQDPHLFFQLEKVDSKGGLHLHFCISVAAGTPRDVSSMFKAIERRVSFYYFGVEGLTFFTPHKNKHGAWKSNDEGFIVNYLLKKLPLSECVYAWTNMDGVIGNACLNEDKRRELLSERQDQGVIKELTAPTFKAATGDKMLSVVDWMCDNDVTTERRWEEISAASLYSFLATPAGTHLAKQCLRAANQRIVSTKPLGLSLCKFASEKELRAFQNGDPELSSDNNRIYYLFAMNNYCPDMASMIFFWWSMRQTGKRNSIWLFGPATTGKTNLASAIAHTAASYGCVNWNNANFPFQDIVNVQLGWWEEGKMTEDVVECAKALLGGSNVRVDRKCMQSAEVQSPPFIITSNTDMCLVSQGSYISFEHQQPLQDRMIKFEFNHVLSGNFGLISEDEVVAFFRNGAYNVLKHAYMRKAQLFALGPASLPYKPPTGELVCIDQAKSPSPSASRRSVRNWMTCPPDPVQDDPAELDEYFPPDTPPEDCPCPISPVRESCPSPGPCPTPPRKKQRKSKHCSLSVSAGKVPVVVVGDSDSVPPEEKEKEEVSVGESQDPQLYWDLTLSQSDVPVPEDESTQFPDDAVDASDLIAEQ